MKTFDTEQEAQDALKESNSIFNNMTCPVFKDNCILSLCHSFYEGDVVELKYSSTGTKYRVRETQCTCSIVTGIVVMEAE